MRTNALLLFEHISRDNAGKFVLRQALNTLFSKVWPARPVMWIYFHVEVDEGQEEVPINIRYESVPDGGGATGGTVVIADVDRIGPRRDNGARFATFSDYFQTEFTFPSPGYYEIRAYVDNEPAGTFTVRVTEWVD